MFSKIDDLIGSACNDVLIGSFVANMIEGGGGADTLNGGAGLDTASYARDSVGVIVSLDSGAASGGDAAGDVLSNFENLRGGLGNDALVGDGAGNVLWGGAGIDTLTGQGGDDTLEGGASGDLLQGGDGVDWASYAAADGGVSVNLGVSGQTGSDATGDVFSSIEAVRGSVFDDVITGDASENTLEGDDGADTLAGGDGVDTLSYANSDGRVDRLEARGGDDTLIGGTQNDNLKGGGGADVFVLNFGDGADLIADWQDGFDRIDLSDFQLSFGDIQAASTALPIGALFIDLGSGDSFQINNFAMADFDSGDVIV